jgi:SOS response regulatory protein OraA/RecX
MPKATALDKIATYLGRRDYSSFELEQRLKRDEFKADEIKAALVEATQRRWILPPEELAMKVALALGHKGKSASHIEAYLKKLKLPIVTPTAQEEIQKALALVNKRLKLEPPFSYEQKQKILQFLTNRSYDEACIRKVIHHEIS